MTDEPPQTGTPRWVKVSAVIAATVILLFIIVILTRGPGGHGPDRHLRGLTFPVAVESAQSR